MLIIRKENNKEGRVRKFFKSLTQGTFFGGPKNQKTCGAPLLATLLFALFSVIFLHTTYVLALATKSSTPASLPSNGLVAHHTFDGKKLTSSTSTDSSSQGNNGTLTNGPKVAIGKVGQALYFDGVDDYITFGNNILAPDAGFTASFWVKHATTTVDSYGTVRLKGASSEFLFVHGKTGNSGVGGRALYFGFRGNTAIASSDARYYTDTSSGKWNHYLVVYNGGTKGSAASWKLYINGEDIALGTEGSIGGATNANEIGRDGGAGTPSQSYMDDVRVYNRILTTSEMTQLAGVKITNKSTILTRPLSYYTFDEVAGNALDSGSAKRNLVMTASRTRGKLGRALSTDVNPAYQAMATTSLTVTGWFFINGSGQHADIRLYQNPGEYGSSQFALGSFYCGVACEDRKVGFSRVYHGPEDVQTGASTTVTSLFTSSAFNNRWHHFAGTYSNASGWEFYLDGTLMATSSDTGMTGLASPQLHFVGVTPSLPIDEVRIYDKKLNASEILNIYNTTKGVSQSFGVMATSSLPVSNGLVGHWTFDGKTISTTGATTSAQDVVGGYNGTFTNMSTTTSRVLGKVGQAITFDGADDYISVGTSSVLGNKPLSVSFWAKSNVTTSTYDSPIGKVNTGSWTQGWGFYTTGTSQMNFFIEGYSTNSANFTGLNPRVWHHYVGVWDGTNIYIYVDGVRGSVTDTYTGSMTTSNLLMTIGSIEPDVYYNWNGPIDDVRVYNRALSDKEIITLYKMGA